MEINCTNVTGHGAAQVCKSLLPHLIEVFGVDNVIVSLPSTGSLTLLMQTNDLTKIKIYKRKLPLILSRFFEVTFFSLLSRSHKPLLVMGDFPHVTLRKQALFFHNLSIINSFEQGRFLKKLLFLFSRSLFKMNLHFVDIIFVQSEIVKQQLSLFSPTISSKIEVIRQPPPASLLNHKNISFNSTDRGEKLRLFYPATFYPHKNHKLINLLDEVELKSLVNVLILTISQKCFSSDLPFIELIGHIDHEEVIEQYEKADALLFLSKFESLGLPLLEAMFLGKHIICPDLPYARDLCGSGAIYFRQNDPDSLLAAIRQLKYLVDNKISCDWSEQLKYVPKDWPSVAEKMQKIFIKHNFSIS